MEWQEAREQTLAIWFAIRDNIGKADPLDLLTEINAMCALCEKADEEAGGPYNRCHYCLFYQQFGGCLAVNAVMSECVVARDWDRLRVKVEEFIAHLQQLKLPTEAAT